MNVGLISLNETKHHPRHHILFFTNGVINVFMYVPFTNENYCPLNLLASPP